MSTDFSSVSINIIGKEYFQSKNAIYRLKNDLKSGVNVIKEYSKYLKDGYMFSIHKDDNDINNIIIKVLNIEENNRMIKNKKHFDLKMKELKDKRLSDSFQKNMFEKAKDKYKMDNEVLNLYYELKKYIDRPILNPLDAYNNKEQYIPIIEELCNVFKGDNSYNKYYTKLLSSLKNV